MLRQHLREIKRLMVVLSVVLPELCAAFIGGAHAKTPVCECGLAT